MVNNVLSHLRRGFNLRFLLASLAAMCILFLSFLQPVLQSLQNGKLLQGYHDSLISTALFSEIWTSFTPVLAGIPFASGYIEDVKSKFSRFMLVRGSYFSYLFGLTFSCWLSGSLTLFLGALCAYGLSTLVFLPMEWITDNPPELGSALAGQFLLLTLSGGLWATVGIAISTFMESKYIAYASPFIVYYLLVILYERYLPNMWLLYPKNWLNPELWPYGVGSAVVFLLELTFFAGLLFYIRGRRRLESL